MMYKHLDWANQRILEALRNGEVPQQAIRLFAHILQAEQVWLTRLQGKDSSSLPIWPDIDLAACAQQAKSNNQHFQEYLSGFNDTNVQQIISYSNSQGKQFRTSIHDILTHVALHGQYHRGQINLLLRTAGNEPVNVDFITLVR